MRKYELVVEFDHENVGFDRKYFKVININGYAPENEILICTDNRVNWYTTSGIEHEPDSFIGKSYRIVSTDGTVLRPCQLFMTEIGKLLTPHGTGVFHDFEIRENDTLNYSRARPDHDEFRVGIKLDPGHTWPSDSPVAYFNPSDLVYVIGVTSE